MTTLRAALVALALGTVLAGCGTDPAPAAPTAIAAPGTVAAEPVAFPATAPTEPRGPGRITLVGAADAPTVEVVEASEHDGAPVTTRFEPAASAQVTGSTVRTYRAGSRTLLVLPLGDDDAVALDATGTDGGRPGAVRLALGGRSYAVTPPLPDGARVTAVWRKHRDGTWASPTGEQPRTARFDDLDGALVSWFPTARRTFLSVGTGALGVAAGSPVALPGGTDQGDRPGVLTDGPQAVYAVHLLPADAHDVATGHQDRTTVAARPVDGAVVALVREELDPQADSYGVLPAPPYTDGSGRHDVQGVPAIGVVRSVWPDVPGAPRVTTPGIPDVPETTLPADGRAVVVRVAGSSEDPTVTLGGVRAQRVQPFAAPDGVRAYRTPTEAVLLVRSRGRAVVTVADRADRGGGARGMLRLGPAEWAVTLAPRDVAPADVLAVYRDSTGRWTSSTGDTGTDAQAGGGAVLSWFPGDRTAIVSTVGAKDAGGTPGVARRVPSRPVEHRGSGIYETWALLPAGAREVHLDGVPGGMRLSTAAAGDVLLAVWEGPEATGPAPPLGDLRWTAPDGAHWVLPPSGPARRR